jgi:hypothetical protein
LRWCDGSLRRGGGDRGVNEEAGEELGFRLGADGGEARVPRVPVEPLAMSDEEDRERSSE